MDPRSPSVFTPHCLSGCRGVLFDIPLQHQVWDGASRLAQPLESWAQTSSRSSASLGSAGEEDPSAMWSLETKHQLLFLLELCGFACMILYNWNMVLPPAGKQQLLSRSCITQRHFFPLVPCEAFNLCFRSVITNYYTLAVRVFPLWLQEEEGVSTCLSGAEFVTQKGARFFQWGSWREKEGSASCSGKNMFKWWSLLEDLVLFPCTSSSSLFVLVCFLASYICLHVCMLLCWHSP